MIIADHTHVLSYGRSECVIDCEQTQTFPRGPQPQLQQFVCVPVNNNSNCNTTLEYHKWRVCRDALMLTHTRDNLMPSFCSSEFENVLAKILFANTICHSCSFSDLFFNLFSVESTRPTLWFSHHSVGVSSLQVATHP